MLGLLLVPGAAPRAATPVALVFAPWTSRAAALAGAFDTGARFVRPGRLPFVVVVEAMDAAATAGVAASAAWFQVPADGAAGCGERTARS